jgi:hypothetical protein
VEYRSDVLVAQRGSGASFAKEPLTSYFAIEISIINDLERDRTPKIGVESLIGDTHRSPTQLPERTILPPEYLIMLIVLGVGHDFVALTNQMRSKEANGMGAVDPSSRRARLPENAKYFSHSEVQIER